MLPSRRRPVLCSLLTVVLILAVAPAAPARGEAPVQIQARELTHDVQTEHVFEMPLDASHFALHWPGQPEATIRIATSGDGETFGEPQEVEIDEVGANRRDGRTYGALLAAGGVRAIRVTTDRPISQLAVLVLDSRLPTSGFGFGASAAAVTSQPTVIPRSAWGADESLRFDGAGGEIWPREFYPIQKLVVHHTAGANGDPNPAATIRAIYYYHAVTQGWGDIGYNFLVDEAGRVYEGRYSRDYAGGVPPSGDDEQGHGVEAGHARGFNAGTVGISLLGSFEAREPTAEARHALVRVLAWAAAKHLLDPRTSGVYTNPVDGRQSAFGTIAAHRDLNATACPGAVLYNQLPSIRDQVAAEMVERIGGADRYATAAMTSATFFAAGVPTVFIATGLDFPDSVAGGPAAASLRAPILLVDRDRIPDATAAELSRLRPGRIVVLGGAGVVSDAVLAQLARFSPGGASRVSGADRYATAAAISATFFVARPPLTFVATGTNFPDALAGGPAAARNGAPILLVTTDGIPEATAAELSRLSPGQIIVLGGAGVVSDAVLTALQQYSRGGVTRIAGPDRHATSAAIASAFFPSAHAAFVATGLNFPDALAGASPALQAGAPMLLVASFVPATVGEQLRRLRPARVVALGGVGVVSDEVMGQIRAFLGLH
jgi:putative cell wall-binding protein